MYTNSVGFPLSFVLLEAASQKEQPGSHWEKLDLIRTGSLSRKETCVKHCVISGKSCLTKMEVLYKMVCHGSQYPHFHFPRCLPICLSLFPRIFNYIFKILNIISLLILGEFYIIYPNSAHLPVLPYLPLTLAASPEK